MDLPAFIARRLLQMVPVVLGVTILVFFMIHLVPGDPARTMLGTKATPERIALLHKEWGLDKSSANGYIGIGYTRRFASPIGSQPLFTLQ